MRNEAYYLGATDISFFFFFFFFFFLVLFIKAAVDIVRGLTGSEDGLQSLAKYSKIVLPSLSRLLTGPKVLPNIQSMPKF